MFAKLCLKSNEKSFTYFMFSFGFVFAIILTIILLIKDKILFKLSFQNIITFIVIIFKKVISNLNLHINYVSLYLTSISKS